MLHVSKPGHLYLEDLLPGPAPPPDSLPPRVNLTYSSILAMRIVSFSSFMSLLNSSSSSTLNMFRKTLSPLRLQYQEGRPRIHGEGREPLINHLPPDHNDPRLPIQAPITAIEAIPRPIYKNTRMKYPKTIHALYNPYENLLIEGS